MKEDTSALNVRDVAKCCVFSMIRVSGQSKSRPVKAAGAEVGGERRHSRPEDQAPDLLQMTEKRCAMAMAYLLWHLIIASVRRTRSLHTVRQVCTFH